MPDPTHGRTAFRPSSHGCAGGTATSKPGALQGFGIASVNATIAGYRRIQSHNSSTISTFSISTFCQVIFTNALSPTSPNPSQPPPPPPPTLRNNGRREYLPDDSRNVRALHGNVRLSGWESSNQVLSFGLQSADEERDGRDFRVRREDFAKVLKKVQRGKSKMKRERERERRTLETPQKQTLKA